MNILHHTWKVGPASFGLGPVVLNLACEQGDRGHKVRIWTFDSPGEIKRSPAGCDLPGIRIQSFPAPAAGKGFFCPAMLRAGKKTGRSFAIVHQHGLWSANSRLNRTLRRAGNPPTVIAPHGSLEKWALRRSRWKKKLALTLFERENLQDASCLHALSRLEAEGIRAFGLQNPIAVIPNGIDENWLRKTGRGADFKRLFDVPAENRVLLFLSRIAPVKGLPLLLGALAAMREVLGGWSLVVVGPGPPGYMKKIHDLVRRYDLERSVVFTGALFGQRKRDAYDAADLFVLPSHREAAPMVVLEALGAGVPVLTTRGTPWSELGSCGCGWWIEESTEAMTDALEKASSLSTEELRKMGERGRELVASRYLWSKSAEMTLSLYRWLQGESDPPDFVIFG